MNRTQRLLTLAGLLLAPFVLTGATLQDAIDAAAPGATVLVAPGTYTGPGNRDLDFGTKNLVLVGTGGAANTIIDCAGDSIGHRGFKFVQGDHSASVIRGFTIRNGLANRLNDDQGGGVWVNCNGGPTIRECILENCVARSGGGVASQSYGVRIESCQFIENSASGFGGGVRGTTLIQDSEFIDNSALEGGGAHTDARVERCSFRDNRAEFGGGLKGSFAEIYDSEFVNNFAGGHIVRGHGGGIWGGKRVERCVLTGNTAKFGAGIHYGDNINMTTKLYIDCTLQNNASSQAGGGAVLVGNGKIVGGVIQGNTAVLGGGVHLDESSFGYFPAVENCLITGNTATYGGGVAAGDNWPHNGTDRLYLTGCTISGNRAQTGGGVYVDVMARSIYDRTIVRGNCSTGPGPEVCVATASSTAEFTCSALDTAGVDGAGALVLNGPQVLTDPMFCDPALCSLAPTILGSYGLRPGSPPLPANSPCGSLIGARGEACATAGLPGDAPFAMILAPNPFSERLTLSFALEVAGSYAIEVFDVGGRLVVREGGYGERIDWSWNARESRAPSGVYFLRVTTPTAHVTRRVVFSP